MQQIRESLTKESIARFCARRELRVCTTRVTEALPRLVGAQVDWARGDDDNELIRSRERLARQTFGPAELETDERSIVELPEHALRLLLGQRNAGR